MDESDVLEALKRMNEIGKLGLKVTLELTSERSLHGVGWNYNIFAGIESRSNKDIACVTPEEAICEAVSAAWNMPKVQISRRDAKQAKLSNWIQGNSLKG
jgi:hypothetical protein